MGAIRIIAFVLVILVVKSAPTAAAADYYGGRNARAYATAPIAGMLRVPALSSRHREISAFCVMSSIAAIITPSTFSTRRSIRPVRLSFGRMRPRSACAKAIGYLKLGHFRREVDVENIQKCECFHSRMVKVSGSPLSAVLFKQFGFWVASFFWFAQLPNGRPPRWRMARKWRSGARSWRSYLQCGKAAPNFTLS